MYDHKINEIKKAIKYTRRKIKKMKTIKIKNSTHQWLLWIQSHLGKEGQLKTLDGTIEYLFDYWNNHYKGTEKNDK